MIDVGLYFQEVDGTSGGPRRHRAVSGRALFSPSIGVGSHCVVGGPRSSGDIRRSEGDVSHCRLALCGPIPSAIRDHRAESRPISIGGLHIRSDQDLGPRLVRTRVRTDHHRRAVLKGEKA